MTDWSKMKLSDDKLQEYEKISNKKAPDESEQTNKKPPIIISGKTYTVNELNAIFNYNSLMLVESKEELLKYWYMAVETGIKKFIAAVDNVFIKRYPHYE